MSIDDKVITQFRKEIAMVMVKAFSSCGLEREEVAKKMSDILGRKISKNLLDAYASEARETHTPALDVAIAFDLAVGQAALSGYFVSKFGGKIIVGKDIPLLEAARGIRDKELLDQRIRASMLSAGVIDRKTLDTDARLEILEAEVTAYQMILGWLMANHSSPGAFDFLRDQAFGLEDSRGGKEKYEQEIAAFDGVREFAMQWQQNYPKS
jgi:hypothetical protein